MIRRKELNAVLKVAVAVSLLSSGLPTWGCSAVACISGGPEVRREFVVVVEFDGKPLQGAKVQVTALRGGAIKEQFSGVTPSNGSVRVTGLAPGEYWLSVDMLGITAAYHCFHISGQASRKAKRRMTYEWGDFPTLTRRAAGMLVDSQPGSGGTPLENLVRRRNLPVAGATVTLHDPFTWRVVQTTSDSNGKFSFDSIRTVCTF